MTKQAYIVVRCSKRELEVQQGTRPNTWVTSLECPAGHPAGMLVLDLLAKCRGGCPHAVNEKAAEAPAPAPAPEEKKVSVVRKLGEGAEISLGGNTPAAGADVEVAPPPPAVKQDVSSLGPPALPPAVEPPAAEPELELEPPAPPEELPPASLPPATMAPAPPGMEPPPAAPAAPPAQQPALIELDDIIMPDGLEFLPKTEASVDIEAALATVPGYMGGPSQGGLSSHVLGDFADCPYRAYLAYRLGRRRREGRMALSWGSLFHACLAMKYQYGVHRMAEPIQAVIQAGAPKLASEVREVVDYMHKRYAEEETHTWCPRAVEHNVIWFLEPQRINGKNVAIPISSRIDLILALKRREESCPGLGPAPQGAMVVDHKSAASLSYDLVKGYSRDWQLRMYALAFLLGGQQEVFGKLIGIMVNIAVKHKQLADKSFFRERAAADEADLMEFYHQEIIPHASRFWSLLSGPDKDNPSAWVKNSRACFRWGMCDYFQICDGGRVDDDVFYYTDEKQILSLDRMAEPSKKEAKAKREAAADAELVQRRASMKGEKKAVQDKIRAAIADGLMKASYATQGWDRLQKEKFLTANHTDKQVLVDLGKAIESVCTPLAQQGADWTVVVPELEPPTVKLRFGSKGWEWSVLGFKGTVTWKQAATEICGEHWFNLSKLEAPGPASPA